ncbi:MAG: FAD-binding oxidoreductase [Actinomycetota bacterium]
MTTVAPIEALRVAGIAGALITPDDERYDRARTVFYGGIDPEPPVIARAADAHDVARVIGVARETGAELAVRSGGHSTAEHSTTENGVVLDLRDLNRHEIDAESRTAWVDAGLTAVEVAEATAAHGLAIGFGDTGTVGVGGITVGGGVGYLVRKHGLTIDDLLAAEVVTADGDILHADETSHPDLFWAIRGGGGNFGVVTRFRFRLHPIDTVIGGMLVLPATPETIAGFIAEAEEAPEELSTIANVMTAPPMPFLPEAAHGERVIIALTCWSGELDAGERALAPFRALAEPLADLLRPMPYPELYPPDDPDYRPIGAHRSMFLDRIDEAAAETILERLDASTAQMAAAQLRVLGGAMARVPSDATAFAHRSSKIMVNLAALCGSVEELPEHDAWVGAFADALRQEDHGVYANFLGSEGEARIRDAYPGATWDRLRRIKARYDPTNLFRLNQNIPPATD